MRDKLFEEAGLIVICATIGLIGLVHVAKLRI